MNNDDKGVELTAPLMSSQIANDSGNFGISPIDLAKFTDLDGTHPIAPDKDMLVSTKLFLDFGGYDKLAQAI
jgi:magnesium-transporting ATPase (P-type)